MKSRGTYVLLVLFFAGLVSLWWADFAQVLTPRQKLRMSSRILPTLIDARPDDLQKIEILGGEEPLVFVRKPNGSGWQMTEPKDVEADPSKVETLAYNLKELSRKPEAATLEGDPLKFGLAPPRRVIRLWGAKTSEPLASLDVGLENEKLARCYVRATGSDAVEVIDSKALALIALPAIRWRDHELFRVPSFEIDGVSLKSDGNELRLQRGRDAWRVESPIKTLAAEAKVDGLIADLGSLRVLDDSRFIADNVKNADLERYGLKKPVLTIEVDAGRATGRRPTQILHVGKPVEGNVGQVYVRREGQDDVLAVDSRALKDLRVNPNLFRSSKVADIKVARVSKIAVEQPGGNFEVLRNGNDWAIAGNPPLKADRKAIDDFLKAIDKLETNNFRDPGTITDTGLDKSSLVLKIWEANTPPKGPPGRLTQGSPEPEGEPALSLRVGRKDAGRRAIYAQLVDDPTVLALPFTETDIFPRSPLAFRDRQILNETTEPIERITLSGNGRKFVLNAPPLKFEPFRMVPLGWWMVEPVDAPADAASVGVLLRLLTGMRAETLVAEDPVNLEQYGLKTPFFQLTWSSLPTFSMVDEPTVLPPGSTRISLKDRSLLVGSAVTGRPDLRYAKISDRPLIFTIGREILEILDFEFRDHQVLSFKPARVKKVRIDWPTLGLDVERSHDSERRGWTVPGSLDSPDFNPNDVNTLLTAASNLATTKYAQHSGEFPRFTGFNPSRLSIRFELDDGSNPRTLRIGATVARGNVLATTETGSSGSVFMIPETLVKAWLKPPTVNLPENVFAP